LAAMLNMHVYFGRSVMIGGSSPYGNAVLSKYPILEAKVIDIPDPVGQKHVEHRTLTRAVIDAPEGRIAVYATHFGLSAPEHEHAVSTTLAALANEPLPFVLMGDLNMTPDNPLIAAMNETLCGTDDLLAGQLTFPSEAADRKIDYIFTSKTVRVTAAQVIPKMASDHFPIIAEIEY
ncbi:MAG: endonuclease/exonuclease/phosphatase family protein, partial [Clostridia bacterium]|nr:endonuclease/exonuclease/phosphatase family protein [Clostridia bacterium]